MTAYRLFFFFHYKADGKAFSGSMLLMGLRYDLRVVAVVGTITLLLIEILKPFKNAKGKKQLLVFLSILFSIFIIAYASDFYYYDYLKK